MTKNKEIIIEPEPRHETSGETLKEECERLYDERKAAIARAEKAEVAAKEAEKKPAASMIPMGADGRIATRTISETLTYCNSLVTGEGVPQRFNTPQKLFAALMFVRDLRLPDTSIRQVANIHGTMSAFGDIPLALAQRSRDWGSIKEQWFDKDYNVICFENKNLTAEMFGAVCWLSRGRDPAQSFVFTLDDAKTAGVYPCSNKNLPWHKYTKLMMRYKARSIAIKSLYADCINGLAIGEYDFDSTLDGNQVSTAKMRDVSDDKISGFRSNLGGDLNEDVTTRQPS